jgi:aryl-alcohol dehydrogenase-like predicted oxidoreductase
MQSRILGGVPDPVREQFSPLEEDSQRAIQFARSAPGVVAPLVGMKSRNHIFENLKTIDVPPLSERSFYELFPEA